MVVNAGKVYALHDDGVNIHYNDISLSDGSIDGTWTNDTGDEVVGGREQAAFYVWNNFIYIAGGDNTTVLDSTYYVKINADGSLQQVGETGNGYGADFYSAVRYPSMVISKGVAVVMGGCDNIGACSALDSVEYALINNGGGGGVNNVKASTSLGSSVKDHCSVSLNNYVYTIGGTNSGGSAITTVNYSLSSSDGSLAAWATTTALPSARTKLQCLVYDNILYAIGGSNGTNSQTTVYYTTQNSDGTLASWTTSANSLSTARENFAAVAYGDKMYVLGGYGTSGADQLTSVEASTIGTGGAPGSWSTSGQTALSAKRQGHDAVVYGGYVVVVGGYSGSTLQDTVEVSQISGGNIGSWDTRVRLPKALDETKAIALNGYLYVVGGRYSTSGTNNNQLYTNEVFITPLLSMSSGMFIGEWDTSQTFTTSYYINQHSLAYANGFMYVIGGSGGATGVTPSDQSAVKYTGLQSISRKGTYTRYLEVAGTLNYNIDSIEYTGTVAGGSSVNVSVRAACEVSNSQFQNKISLNNLESGTSYPIDAVGHYILIVMTIDDSTSASYHDADASTITQIDIVYTLEMPPADSRLFGGKYFKDQIEQPLDTASANPGGSMSCT